MRPALPALCAAFAALIALPTRAELPPDAYRDMQRAAPEALTVRVAEVDVSICWFWLCDGRDVTVEAEVTAVQRSAAGLTPGAQITIRYRNVPLGGRSGPRPIRVVAEGEQTPAWLEETAEGHFRAAARGASFSPAVKDR